MIIQESVVFGLQEPCGAADASCGGTEPFIAVVESDEDRCRHGYKGVVYIYQKT